MQKEQRQTAILELIATRRITRQEEITEYLEIKGFPVTQSSVSRDLLDLGVVKVGGAYARPQRPPLAMMFGLKTLEVAGENLVVAKCDAGLASAVAVRIDAEMIDEIVGTIAGDDTIFIATKGGRAQKAVLRKVWEIFEPHAAA